MDVETTCPIDAKFSDQVAVLLTPPSPLLVKEYFQELISQRKCPLKVNPDGIHGKGVFAESEFDEDELVFKDRILVGDQHSSNKIDCFVCSFCFQYIGSIELQIGRKLYLRELGVSTADECGSSNGPGCGSSSSSLHQETTLPRDTVTSLMNGGLQLPHSEKFPLPSAVPCPGGCKEAYYCSKSCAEADWDSCHSLLCVQNGSSPKAKALLNFMQHANDTNDIFILASKVIAFTILRFRKLKATQTDSRGKNVPSDLFGNYISPLLLEAWKPVSMGYKKRWWDCIALPEDVESSEEGGFRNQIKDLAFTSLQLLKDAIYDEECAPLFSLNVYGHIIGMFELNNLDLVVASPVEDYFLYIDDLPVPEKKKAEKITQSFLDALGDEYSISCQGTAFYPLQSCINHSCIPNAKAFKREEDRDGQAVIMAVRPICKGEEITISYIDEDLPYEERQESLADYGFICKCARCLEEEHEES